MRQSVEGSNPSSDQGFMSALKIPANESLKSAGFGKLVYTRGSCKNYRTALRYLWQMYLDQIIIFNEKNVRNRTFGSNDKKLKSSF